MRLCLRLFSLLFLLALKSAAQDTAKIQSLHYQVITATMDSGKAESLIKLAWEFRNANLDSAIYYDSIGLNIALKIGNDTKIAKAKYQLGRFYYTKGNDSISRAFFDQCLVLYENLKDTANMSTVHMQLGYYYSRLNRDADMLNEFLLSLKLAEASKSADRISDALYSVSDYYIQREQYKTAVTYLQQSLEIDKRIDDKANIGSDYQYLGLCYSELNQPELAKDYLSKGLVIFREINDKFRVATAYSYMADLNIKLNENEKGLQNYFKAMNLMDTLGAKNEYAGLCDNIAQIYVKRKDYQNAMKYAKLGEQAAKSIGAMKQIYYVYSTMAQASAGMHDYKSAYDFLYKASDLKDTLLNREENDKLAELQTKFETEKKEKENLLLKAQNETANANLQRNQVFLIAAIIGIILLGAFLYMIYQNKQGKERHIKTLEDFNTRLQEQADEIGRMNTILQLKNLRAQMNPHFIFNCMSSIQECILLGEVDNANRYLSKLSKLLRMVLLYAEEESITLDKELQMLELYLQLESVRLKKNFEYKIEVDENLFPDEINIPTLILQPFVENAIWHGLQFKEENRKLLIKITCEKNFLYCIIEDNGIGRLRAAQLMQMKTHHESKGLKIVGSRLQILQSRSAVEETGFSIIDLFDDRNEASGTRVCITLPLAS